MTATQLEAFLQTLLSDANVYSVARRACVRHGFAMTEATRSDIRRLIQDAVDTALNEEERIRCNHPIGQSGSMGVSCCREAGHGVFELATQERS